MMTDTARIVPMMKTYLFWALLINYLPTEEFVAGFLVHLIGRSIKISLLVNPLYPLGLNHEDRTKWHENRKLLAMSMEDCCFVCGGRPEFASRDSR